MGPDMGGVTVVDGIYRRIGGLGGFDRFDNVVSAGIVLAIAEDNQGFAGAGFHHLRPGCLVDGIEERRSVVSDAIGGYVRIEGAVTLYDGVKAAQKIAGGRGEIGARQDLVPEADEQSLIGGAEGAFGEGLHV